MNHSKVKNAALVSIIVSGLVFLIKFLAFYWSASEAVFSDAIESTVNIIAALFALWSIQMARKPADTDHPYGHGKFESLSSAFEGGLISCAGIIIAFKAVFALIYGVELKQLGVGLFLLTLAGVINGGLSYYLIHIGKKYNSHALVASGKHVISDFYTSVGAFIALILVSLTSIKFLDPLIAFFLGLQLLWMGLNIFKSSLSVLTDEHDEPLVRNLGHIFSNTAFPGIIRIHHTRVMRSGFYHHIDTHVVVPEFWSVEEAHQKTDEFEYKVLKQYAHSAELHIHMDPCFKKYCSVCDLKDCPIRQAPFEKKIAFTYEELISPDERT